MMLNQYLETFARLCLKYEAKPIASLLNVYSASLEKDARNLIAENYLLFFDVGNAARAKNSILRDTED